MIILPLAVVFCLMFTVRSGVIQTDRPFGASERFYPHTPTRQSPPYGASRSGLPGPAFTPPAPASADDRN